MNRHLLVLLPSSPYLGEVGAISGRSAVSVQYSVHNWKKVKQVYRLFGRVYDEKYEHLCRMDE